MEIIHCRLPMDVLCEYGRKIGEIVKPDMDARRYNHAGSWILCFRMVDEIGEMAMISKHSYTEIVGSFGIMTKWLNYAKIAKCMCVAVECWLNPQASVIFDDYYLRTGLEEYPQRIHEDLSVFATWVMYYGADGASLRREIPSRVIKDLQKIIKKIGDDGIICMFWRSLIAFQALCEKCIVPAYREALRHGARERVQFGQMRGAFEGLKKSA